MGIRGGAFHPSENYRKVEPIFRELSKLLFVEWQERRDTENYETLYNPSPRSEELRTKIENLNLRLETADGRLVKRSYISLEDHSDVLDEEARELDIVVEDNETKPMNSFLARSSGSVSSEDVANSGGTFNEK